MKILNKIKLIERITKELYKQLATHEAIESFLNLANVPDSVGIPIDADWEVHLKTRLELLDDDARVKIAQEDLELDISDLLE